MSKSAKKVCGASAAASHAVPRKRRRDFVRWSRLALQVAFFVLAPQAFSMAFSGARSLMVALGRGEAADVTSFVLTLVLLLAHAVVFGRFFCGYACSFGTLGDVLYQLGKPLRRALHAHGHRLSARTEDVLRLIKYIVLAVVLVASFAGAGAVVSAVSPWTAFGQLVNVSPTSVGVVGVIVLLALCALMVAKERSFCEYLCPLGALFSLMPILPRSNRHVDPGRPGQAEACRRRCPVRIAPPGEGPQMGECVQCDRCETVAQAGCVNFGPALRRAEEALDQQGFAVDRATGRPTSYEPARDRRTRRVALVAASLLIALWLGGAVSFLPAPPWA